MTKKIITFTFLILPAFAAFSQVAFGVKGGLNLNRLVMINPPTNAYGQIDQKSTLSYHAGVFSKIKLSEKISLMPELQFIQKGYKLTGNYHSMETNYKINYLEMPLMVAYSPARLLSIELGPTAGVFLKATTANSAGSYQLQDELFEKVEFGITGGVRFNFTEKLSAASRYYYGLSHTSSIFFTEDGKGGILTEMYHHNVQFSLYYVLKQF